MMDGKASEKMYPELFIMFAGYFNQHFDTVTEGYDEDKPVVPQLTYTYKKDCNKEQLEATAKELEDLINKHYTEDLLDKITYELGMWVNVNYYGYTHMQFLREMLSLLRDEQYRPID